MNNISGSAKPGARWLLLGLTMAMAVSACVEGEQIIDEKSVATVTRESGQQGMSVTEVLAARESLANRQVTVYGKAGAGLAFEFIGEQPYLLEHGNQSLWVITADIVPQEGAWVTVTGVLMVPYQLKGRHYQAALVEGPKPE